MDNRLITGRSRFEACRAKEGKRTDAGAQRPTDWEEDDMAPMPDEAPIPAAVLLSNDSPLRRLPTAQHRRQQLALDEISMSVDMTAMGCQQLRVALWLHSKTTDRTTSRLATVHAVTNAWSVIDAGHRLRVLVRKLPGLKHGPAVVSFLQVAEQVEPLRNGAAPGRCDRGVTGKRPASPGSAVVGQRRSA
jgi:hypothetical protein